jgi:hypothetical protein
VDYGLQPPEPPEQSKAPSSSNPWSQETSQDPFLFKQTPTEQSAQQDTQRQMAPEPFLPELPAPQGMSQSMMPQELPDFTADDLSVLAEQKPTPTATKSVPLPAPAPKEAVDFAAPQRTEQPAPATQEITAPELPEEQFLSSHSYFGISADIKQMRKTLRMNDDTIKEAILRHEQLDQLTRRVALDTNNIQEQLIKIDESLFS